MTRFLRITVFIAVVFSSQLVVAQDYRLTQENINELIENKRFSKLGLGFQELRRDPSAIDKFIMKDGRLSFIATTRTGSNPQELMDQLVAAGMKDCVVLNDIVCGRMAPDQVIAMESIPALEF
ncbi:MAG: hypothetical protein AAF551_09660, partial [Bacteroidota bacterium]